MDTHKVRASSPSFNLSGERQGLFSYSRLVVVVVVKRLELPWASAELPYHSYRDCKHPSLLKKVNHLLDRSGVGCIGMSQIKYKTTEPLCGIA